MASMFTEALSFPQLSDEAMEKKAKNKERRNKKSSKQDGGSSKLASTASVSSSGPTLGAPSEFGAVSGEILSKATQDVERRKQKKKSNNESKKLAQEGGESAEQARPLKSRLPKVDHIEQESSGPLSPSAGDTSKADDNQTLEETQSSSLKQNIVSKEGAGDKDATGGDDRSVHSDESSIFSAHPMSSKVSPIATNNKFTYDRSSMLDDTDSVVGGMMGRSDESVATFGVLVKQRPADDTWNNVPGIDHEEDLKLPAKEEPPPMIPMAISATKKKRKPKKSPPSQQKQPPAAAASKPPKSWDTFNQQNGVIDLEHAVDVYSIMSGSVSASTSASNSASYSHSYSASGRSAYTGKSRSSGEITPQVRNVAGNSEFDSAAPSGFEQQAAETEWEWTTQSIAPSAFERKAADMGWTLPASLRPEPPPKPPRDPVPMSRIQRAPSTDSSTGESRTMADMLVLYLRSMGTNSSAASDIALRFRDHQRRQQAADTGDESLPNITVNDASERSGRGQRSSRRARSQRGRRLMYERAMAPGAVPMEGRAFGAPQRPDLPQKKIVEEKGHQVNALSGTDEPSLPGLVEATAVKDLSSEPVVYADSTPLSIKDLLMEQSIRRRLYVLTLIFLVSIITAVSMVVGRGKQSSDGSTLETKSPTAAPSTSPTLISAATSEYAAQLSGEDVVSDPASAQFKTVGWLSTFDTIVDGFGEVFEQRYAMGTFYYSLGGENWLEKDQWMSPDMHECEWSDSIFCRIDGTGRRKVYGLDLTRNGLEGSLPEELQYTPQLEFLRLSKNKINGTLPNAVFSLPLLGTLDVNGNDISGPFPSNVGDEKSLVFIDTSNNQMSGSLPIGFYSLSLLRIGELSGNQFTGTIASEFGQFKVLSKLNVGSNLLTGSIPNFDEDNTPLFDSIDLSNNMLTGTIPEWFTRLLSRQELLLNDNFFTGTIPSVSSEAIGEFLANPTMLKDVRLKKVDLSNNQFTGTIPAWAGFFTSLQYIDFGNNRFTGTLGLGEFLGARLWTGVETFRIGNNLLSGTVPGLFPHTVREVDLRGNLFTGTIPLEIGELTSLQFLSLDNNVNLGGEIAPILQSSLNLKTFTARNTSISGQFVGTQWKSLENMEILDLSYTSCRGTVPPEWGRLQALKKLILGSNELTGLIPSALGQLADLSSLELNDNTFVGMIPSEIGLLESLKILNLSNNNLLGNVPTELGQLQSLDAIALSGNGLLQGSLPAALCSPEVNFTRLAIGCQLECSCCSDEAGVCEIRSGKSNNVFNHGSLRG